MSRHPAYTATNQIARTQRGTTANSLYPGRASAAFLPTQSIRSSLSGRCDPWCGGRRYLRSPAPERDIERQNRRVISPRAFRCSGRARLADPNAISKTPIAHPAIVNAALETTVRQPAPLLIVFTTSQISEKSQMIFQNSDGGLRGLAGGDEVPEQVLLTIGGE
jgi:hypothetical protein